MQFNKNTSSGGFNIIGIIIKSILGMVVILGLVFSISLIDLPAWNGCYPGACFFY